MLSPLTECPDCVEGLIAEVGVATMCITECPRCNGTGKVDEVVYDPKERKKGGLYGDD